MTMLFDFYGELLTDRQKEFFDLYYNEDLSLSEIAENEGISRQGVRDVIVRAEAAMQEIEDKTGNRFNSKSDGRNNNRILTPSYSEDSETEDWLPENDGHDDDVQEPWW